MKDNNKHDQCVVYIHGLGGSSKEACFYDFLKDRYDVVGIDYQDGNPWEVKNIIVSKFKEIANKYKEVFVIANSIGAFYTYMYLSSFNIKEAYFISPFVVMKEYIESLMNKNNISFDKFVKKQLITFDDGQSIYFPFYNEVITTPISWNVKTHILYGDKDILVPNIAITDFASLINADLTIMKDGEHWFHTESQLSFLKEWIIGIIG